MNYFTSEHEMFRESLRDFLNKEVKGNIEKWESDQKIPKEIWKKMGNQGFLGLCYPEKYGGANLDFFFDVILFEEMSKMNSGGFVITQQVVQCMSSPYILKYGSEFLKNKYLPGIISGELIGCIGITEPDTGSDVKNIKTRAEDKGDYFLINGSKTFITNGMYGDFVVTVVKTDSNIGTKGISLVVIDLKSEGINRTKINKLGWHSSDTAEISFDNVKVPKENLVGEKGKGFYYLMNGLQLERLIFVPSCIGAMEYAMSESIKYMKQRKSFGKTIDQFQVLRHKIATLSSEIESVKVFGYYCCELYNKNEYDVKLCSMAKLLSTELHEKVSTECLQFFGGNGFSEEYPMARMYRDSRVGTIGAGTSEIMKEIISKIVLEETEYNETKS